MRATYSVQSKHDDLLDGGLPPVGPRPTVKSAARRLSGPRGQLQKGAHIWGMAAPGGAASPLCKGDRPMNAPVPTFFGLPEPVRFEGSASANPLAYHYYDKAV